MLPKVINWACKQKPTIRQREKVIPLASGRILEIGIGSGLNLPFYDSAKVQHLTAIDPSEELWKENITNTDELGFGFQFIKAIAEDIPEENNSFDSAVITYALCSIPDTDKALAEIRRVLKANGTLIFCEHGVAPESSVKKWQNALNPLWKRLGGGCNLNRDIPSIIENNGFAMSKIDTMYIPGWKPASYNYWGTAKPR